jgi:hypothetical protein
MKDYILMLMWLVFLTLLGPGMLGGGQDFSPRGTLYENVR